MFFSLKFPLFNQLFLYPVGSAWATDYLEVVLVGGLFIFQATRETLWGMILWLCIKSISNYVYTVIHTGKNKPCLGVMV